MVANHFKIETNFMIGDADGYDNHSRHYKHIHEQAVTAIVAGFEHILKIRKEACNRYVGKDAEYKEFLRFLCNNEHFTKYVAWEWDCEADDEDALAKVQGVFSDLIGKVLPNAELPF